MRHTGRRHEPRGRDGAVRPQAKERHGRPAAPEAGDGQEGWSCQTSTADSQPPGGPRTRVFLPVTQLEVLCHNPENERVPHPSVVHRLAHRQGLLESRGLVSLTSSFPNCSVFIATCPAICWRKVRFVSLWSSFQSYRLPFPPTAPRVKSVHMASVVERQLP